MGLSVKENVQNRLAMIQDMILMVEALSPGKADRVSNNYLTMLKEQEVSIEETLKKFESEAV